MDRTAITVCPVGKVCITGFVNNAVSCPLMYKTESAYSMTAYVLRSLSNYLPNRVIIDVKLSYIRDLQLVDENVYSLDPIDLIMGVNQYGCFF
jgi:hypothetical protein